MSMSCKESRRWISMKVDGERIPFSIEGRLEEHLGACVLCREALFSEQRRAAILRSALRPADAGRLEAGVWKALAEGTGGDSFVPSPFSRSRLPLQAAAVLLVAVGGWLAFRWIAGEPPARGPVADPARTARIILERDQWTGDVISGSDGAPMGRGRRHVRQVILERPRAGAPGDRGAEPVRLDKARTDYIRLTDYPYW